MKFNYFDLDYPIQDKSEELPKPTANTLHIQGRYTVLCCVCLLRMLYI